MTNKELARYIAEGLIETGIEGGYGSVSCSTAGDYPSIGVSQWEGDRADDLLFRIEGGYRFVNKTYSQLVAEDEIDALEELLDSDAGRAAQLQKLSEDCLDYVDELLDIDGFENDASVIYAGMWCPTSTSVVSRFVYNRIQRGYDMNDLETCADTFRDEYPAAAGCEEFSAGYQNRARWTLNYVENLNLE